MTFPKKTMRVHAPKSNWLLNVYTQALHLTRIHTVLSKTCQNKLPQVTLSLRCVLSIFFSKSWVNLSLNVFTVKIGCYKKKKASVLGF